MAGNKGPISLGRVIQESELSTHWIYIKGNLAVSIGPASHLYLFQFPLIFHWTVSYDQPLSKILRKFSSSLSWCKFRECLSWYFLFFSTILWRGPDDEVKGLAFYFPELKLMRPLMCRFGGCLSDISSSFPLLCVEGPMRKLMAFKRVQ